MISNNANNLQTEFTISGEKYGEYEGKIFINHEKIKYTIPIIQKQITRI